MNVKNNLLVSLAPAYLHSMRLIFIDLSALKNVNLPYFWIIKQHFL